jgi:hypothetical protein
MIGRLYPAILLYVLRVCCPLRAQTGSPSVEASQVPVATGITDAHVDARVEALLKKMTLAEKILQRPNTGRTSA